MPFATRTVLIYTLGAAYLGLNSLFVSILQVLSLAELGFRNSSIVDVVLEEDKYIFDDDEFKKELKDEILKNQRLKDENEKLNKILNEVKRSKTNEINKLKEVTKINQLLSDSFYVNASVINRDFDFWQEKLMINVGSNDGITNRMAVVSNGTLIGITDDVSSSNSSVILLCNYKFPVNISVKIDIGDRYVYGILNSYNSEANSSIDETSGKAESFSSKLTSGIATVGKWGTAIVAGATTAVGGLTAFATSSASTADHIDKMSQKIGISRQAYQELDFICSQSGTSVDNLQAGMKSLTSAMDGARDGTASNVAQFERLGVAVTNTDGTFRSQEDVFFDTITALQGMDDQTEKARLATELFGRSGTELLPLLNSESGSIEEMRNQAHELGLVLDDELIDSGVQLTDSLDQTKRAFQSIAVQLGGALMPIITEVSSYIQSAQIGRAHV